MEKSSVEVWNARLCRRAYPLQLHFRGLLWIEDPFARLQFIGPEVRNFLSKSHSLTDECNLYSATTVVDNFIKRGGDQPML